MVSGRHNYFPKRELETLRYSIEETQRLLYESDNYDDAELADQLRALSGRYKIEDFNLDLLRKHITADHNLIHKMLDLVKPINPAQDAKLQVLLAKLKSGIPRKTGKVLIFTQFADTARYLYENLNPDAKAKDIDSSYGTDKSKARMAARFAPLANPHISLRDADPEIPAEHNARVMRIKETFAEEVKHRLAQQQCALNLTVQQRYALRELRAFYTLAEDDDLKSKINALEAAFKHPLSKAINRQLNTIRRNAMTGQNLVRALSEIYLEHNMAEHDFLSRIRTETESEGIPRIICSEALV